MKNFESSKNKERIQTVKFEVPQEVKEQFPVFAEIDKMPEGCAVIGGAARSLASSMMNKNVREPILIRDVDVAYFADEISQDGADAVAEYFSPADFAHGHGVQEIESIDDYMASRDLTMNQIIHKDGELIASRRAIKDIHQGAINPCENRGESYEWDEWNDQWRWQPDEISTRQAMKIVLQKTVLDKYVDGITVAGHVDEDELWRADYNPQELNISPHSSYDGFQLALAIQKAFEYGEDVPQKFLENMRDGEIFEWGSNSYICNEDGGLRELYDIMGDLNEHILLKPFEYRNAAAEYYLNEENDRVYGARMSGYESEDK